MQCCPPCDIADRRVCHSLCSALRTARHCLPWTALQGPAAACLHAWGMSWRTAGIQGIHRVRVSIHPASSVERITSLCVTSMIVQGLHMVRLGAEVRLRGSSGFEQPAGKLCVVVILAGAGMERWQGGCAVECCTCVAAGGVLRLMLACRELGGCLLRPPSLHCKDP